MEETSLTITELFGIPLNCPMIEGMTYNSAFIEDVNFGAILDSFLFR
jgi:hypothetical protein